MVSDYVRYQTKEQRIAREDQRMENRELKVWTECLPKILATLTEIIKYHPARADEKWLESLPELRSCYREAKTKVLEAKTAGSTRHTIQKMCDIINKFDGQTGVKLILCIKRDFKGDDFSLPNAVWVTFKYGNTFPKTKDALAIIKGGI